MKNGVLVLPPEVVELSKSVSATKKAEVQSVLQQVFAGTDDWEKQVDAIDIKGIDDKMSIELAEVARKNSKQARLGAEKLFDAKRSEVQAVKAEYDLEDKLWLKAKQVMQLKFKAIEEKAEWKANYVKRFEAEQKELRTQKRINDVSKYAEINRFEFENMSDESFASFLSGLKSTHEAKRQAEIDEANRVAAEAEAERVRIEEQRLENERLKKESAKREKEIQAERARVKAESDKREAVAAKEKAEFEAKLKAAQHEKDRIAAEEKEKRDKLEAELKAKREKEIQAERDRIAKEQAELAKGDSDKVQDLISDLNVLKTKYVFKSNTNKKMYVDVAILIDKVVNHIKK